MLTGGTAHADLQIRPLQDFYSTTINTTLLDSFRVSGNITGGRSITISADDVNRILGFPRNNFAEIPTDAEITQFFQNILYQGEIHLPRMLKGNLKPEWDLFFDSLAKVFSPTTRSNFNIISSLLQVIGFCIVHNRPINFGKSILQSILQKLGPLRSQSVEQNARVVCFYPQFLMLFLNDKMTDAEKNSYFNSPIAPTQRVCTKMMKALTNKRKYENLQLIVTPYLMEQFNAQPQPHQFQVAHPQQQHQQQDQPSSSEPLPQQHQHTHNLPQTQSTS